MEVVASLNGRVVFLEEVILCGRPKIYWRVGTMSYPTMTVASIRALQELLSNVPPATSSSCSSLTVSKFLVSSLILGFGCWSWVGSAADLN